MSEPFSPTDIFISNIYAACVTDLAINHQNLSVAAIVEFIICLPSQP